MTSNLTLNEIIEKALPTKNITCAIEKRLRLKCREELKAYLLDWHERMKSAEAVKEEKQRVY